MDTLKDYYDYWDKFYLAWRHRDMSAINKLGWTTPTFKGNDAGDDTFQFLPEPWWGNDGSAPLYSVVVNFNPGGGNSTQCRHHFMYTHLYSRFIASQVTRYIAGSKPICCGLHGANDWHYSKRAKRVFDALYSHIIPPIINPTSLNLQNHLSVELIPWHSVSTNNIGDYISCNRRAIFEYSIKFAAKAAMQIDNPVLRNVVLLRMSSSFFKQLMGGIGGFNYLVEEQSVDNACYSIFEFLSIPKVKFVCIWGVGTRNYFPNNSCMNEIIKQIMIYKLNN